MDHCGEKIMWKKIFFYHLPAELPAAVSHAQLPTVLCFADFVRVFFAARDERQYSSIYSVDLALQGDEVRVLSKVPTLCLAPGEIGQFDEHGVFPASIIAIEGRYHLYFIGWNKGATPPLFYAAIGLAFSDDGLKFRRYSVAPIMGRSEHDPCLVTSPNVYRDGESYRMTYVSGVKWTRESYGLQSHYHIKHAVSSNGIDWLREGRIAIDFAQGETNIARSTVVKNGDDSYEMWFSYVNQQVGRYRIGYASSSDGWSWKRNDRLAGIDVDLEACKEMICYPCVFDFHGSRYMLFNGDAFGRDGFGMARLK